MTAAEARDVLDTGALRAFRAKRAEWHELLQGADEHAIKRQVWAANWSYVVFRVLNEARRLAETRNLKSPIRNDTFFRFATAGFVATQALAMRRLTEEEGRTPQRQVISLRRLVADIRANRHLLTREAFVAFDGAPYDPEPARQRWLASIASEAGGEGTVYVRSEYAHSGPGAWEHADRLHQLFDRLSETVGRRRDRFDRVSDSVLDRLVSCLEDPAIAKLRTLTNKRIAHAADPRSRGASLAIGFSLNELDIAHRQVITAAEFVALGVVGESSIGTVPTPAYNAYEHLDAAGFDEDAVRRLDRLAKAVADRRRRWAAKALDSILGTADDPRSAPVLGNPNLWTS